MTHRKLYAWICTDAEGGILAVRMPNGPPTPLVCLSRATAEKVRPLVEETAQGLACNVSLFEFSSPVELDSVGTGKH